MKKEKQDLQKMKNLKEVKNLKIAMLEQNVKKKIDLDNQWRKIMMGLFSQRIACYI